MTTELRAFLPADLTLYAILIRANGDVYSPSQGWGGLSPVYWDYNAIAMTEQTAGVYFADMPAVAAGVYNYVVYEQAGVEPAITDTIKGSGYLMWDGTAEVNLASIVSAVSAEMPTPEDIAVETLGLSFSDVTDPAARSLVNAARREFSAQISGNTLTVFEEDDETPAWTATLVRSTTAQPVVGVTMDP